MAAIKFYQTTSPAQWASAAVHFDNREDWRYFWVRGVRYVAMRSGTSGKLYRLRADARACECRWFVRMGRQCAHQLALELSALHDDLAAQTADQDGWEIIPEAERIAAEAWRRELAERPEPTRTVGDEFEGNADAF